MKTSDWIAIISIAVGLFSTTIGSTVYLSYQIGGLTESVTSLEKSSDEVKFEIKEIRQEITGMKLDVKKLQIKVDILWNNPSLAKFITQTEPNKAQLDALETSKIGKFVEDHYAEILSKVKSTEPHNANETQRLLVSVLNRLGQEPEYKSKLNEAARGTGYDVDSLLFVAALTIKDRVIVDCGFDPKN